MLFLEKDNLINMNKTTIVVNDIAASPGGGLTVLKYFYQAVIRRTEEVNWIFLLSKRYIEDTQHVKVILLPEEKKRLNRIIFDLFTGSKVINKYEPTVVFSLQNTVVYRCNGKRVTYIHQSLPFQGIKSYSFFEKSEFELACIQHLLGFIIKNSIKHSDLNIVQTKWMKNAVEKSCSVNNVKQIYPNMPNIFQKAEYVTTNIFFYPTNSASYKNNELLINATKRLLQNGLKIKTVMTAEGLDNDITFTGRIPIEQVYQYYSSSCLVFPSYIETFGYPLLEARSVGTIILASDCEFSHELLDGYENAYFFNPFDEIELASLMKKVAVGIITRREPKNKWIADSSYKNTWNKVIDEILKVALEK